MNYDNLTDQQIKDIVNECAKDNPFLLTAALRAAGNFVYLLTANDILDFINERKVNDLADANEDEVKEVLEWRNSKMGDLINYGDLCEDALDSLRIARNEHKNSNPE